MDSPTDTDLNIASGVMIGKVLAFEFLSASAEFVAASKMKDYIKRTEQVTVDYDGKGGFAWIQADGTSDWFKMTDKAYG